MSDRRNIYIYLGLGTTSLSAILPELLVLPVCGPPSCFRFRMTSGIVALAPVDVSDRRNIYLGLGTTSLSAILPELLVLPVVRPPSCISQEDLL